MCVCVVENMRHISRVYANEPRCTWIHTKTESVYKGHFFHCLGKRVSEKPRTVNVATAQRNDDHLEWRSLKHPGRILMSVQTLHRNECITVHWSFFFSFSFFTVDMSVVWGKERSPQRTLFLICYRQVRVQRFQKGGLIWRWPGLLKACCLSSDYILICRV